MIYKGDNNSILNIYTGSNYYLYQLIFSNKRNKILI